MMMLGVASLALASCASSNMKKEWDCGAQEGLGCRSIAEIQSTIVRTGDAPAASMIGVSGRGGVQSVNLKHQGVPMWERDQIMKIFIGDYVDSSNNYHTESVIYTVIREAGWATE